MGRLKQISSRLARPAPRVGFLEPEHDKRRAEAHPWRSWYGTARWQALRWSCLVRDLFTCQRCRHVEADTSQLVADHKRPHRGDPDLFWDPANLQCLCKGCHDRVKQAEEAADRARGVRT